MTETDRHLAAIVEQLKLLNHNLQQAFPPLLPPEVDGERPCCSQPDNQIPLGFQSSRWACAQCGKEGGE